MIRAPQTKAERLALQRKLIRALVGECTDTERLSRVVDVLIPARPLLTDVAPVLSVLDGGRG